MSFQKHQLPLRLTLNESKHFVHLIACIHTLALVASLLNNLPISLKGLLLLAITCHYYIYSTRQKAKHYRLEYNEIGWQLAENDEFLTIEILPSTVVSRMAIFLHYKTEHKPINALVIFNDALVADDYRYLITKLKITQSIHL
jgi:hypothetical protein